MQAGRAVGTEVGRREVTDIERLRIAAERRAESLKQAQAEETSVLEKARAEATASLGSIRDRVAKEAADARVLLKRQAELLSVDISEKILGRSL